MARVLSAYSPGSSRVAGKLKRPLSSVATLTVMVEPAFLALTTTPSMRPSLADDTVPASAAGDWLWASDVAAERTSVSVATKDRLFTDMAVILDCGSSAGKC